MDLIKTDNRGATRVDLHRDIRLVVVDEAPARADTVRGREHPIAAAGKACQAVRVMKYSLKYSHHTLKYRLVLTG